MKNLIFLFFICLLLSTGNSIQLTGTSYQPCDLSPGKISSISVEPCTQEPCAIASGDSVDVEAKFEATHDTGSDCVVKSSFLFSGSWYEFMSEPACGGDVECPLVAGSSYTLRKTMLVTDELPKGQQQTRWKLICNAGVDQILCADVTLIVN